MTPRELQEQLAAWIRLDVDNKLALGNLKARIDFLADVLYDEYKAGMGAGALAFRHKLASWLASEPTASNRLLMYRMLGHLLFVGPKEFDSLYLTAFSRSVVSWILSTTQIGYREPHALTRLNQEVSGTCFCAVTDSFNVGSFIRMNALQGVTSRVTWSSLPEPFDPVAFETNFLVGKSRVVLLEDFVGSGTQSLTAVERACQLPSQPKVLFCPLVICPEGDRLAKGMKMQYPNLGYEPVLVLPRDEFVTPAIEPGQPQIFESFRQLAIDVHPRVRGVAHWPQDAGPFGYSNTGALVVKYDNCPDNTLPLIHHESDSPWSALFLRVTRE